MPLNDTGIAQAEAAADVLRNHPISRIISSPARRVTQTVQPLRQSGEIPLQTEDDLMEFFVGSFEGRSFESIRASHNLQDGQSWLTVLPDDADRWQEFVPRVCAAVRRWTDHYAEETLLIASHGLVFRALAEALTGTPRTSRNAEPHQFIRAADGWVVEKAGQSRRS